MEFSAVQVEKPEAVNFIFGQSHFIKTVEDQVILLVEDIDRLHAETVQCISDHLIEAVK